jgi:hypothetical protein
MIAGLFVVAALGGTACGPASKQSCPTDYGPGRVGLCIDEMSTTVTSDREVAVHATITSVLSSAIAGRVWWVIAPIGPGAPWERAVYQSPTTILDYTQHYHISLTWNSPVTLPSDFYELALVVHRVNDDGSETHADYRNVGPIHMGSGPGTQPWLIHHYERAGPVIVTSASGPQSDGGRVNPLSRSVTVTNQGTTFRGFSVRLEARTLPAGWEDRWWLGKTLYTTASVSSIVDAGRSKTVQIDELAPPGLMAAYPNAQFWLTVLSEGRTTDEGLLGGSETFRSAGSKLLFRRSPSGPIELAGISGPPQWTNTTRSSVNVTVRNLTDRPQSAKVFWYLARSHDLQPWTDAVVEGTPIVVSLGPWATTAVVVESDQTAPSGRWDLSAWVHYRTVSGDYAHSDGVFLAQPVSVS